MSNTKLFSAVVARVLDEFTVVINRGSDDGIEANDEFLLYALDDEELFDPETGASLGNLEVVRGTGYAEHVQPKLATIRSNRMKSGKRVIRRVSNTSLRGLMSPFGHFDEIIEEPSELSIPYYGVRIGDKVKRV